LFLKKHETGSNRQVSVRFLGQKPVWLGFFPVWLSFFLFGFGSVFSVSDLQNRNRTEPVSFFKILIGLIGFFHNLVFSVIFFI